MSFATDLYTLMINDTSLNTLSENNIHYEILPENFDLTKPWIVYSFNKTGQLNCLSNPGCITLYSITLKIISTSTESIETLNDYIITYLNGKEQNGIKDITFVNDNHSIDMEKGIYVNQLQFDAIYF